MSELIMIRLGTKLDESFIYATWLKGYFYGNPDFADMQPATFYAVYPRVIETILNRLGSNVVIACLKDDPEVIIGYAVFTDKVLHYAYVKQPFRSQGVLRALIASNPGTTEYSHKTKPAKALAAKFNLTFNPILDK